MDLNKPNIKRRKHFDVSLCVICNEDLGSPNDSNFVNNPTSEGLRSLIEACKIRADDVASFILSVQDDILSKKIKISYHKMCRPPTLASLTSDIKATSNKMKFPLRLLQLIRIMKDRPVSS